MKSIPFAAESYSMPNIGVYADFAPDAVASLAFTFAERWGMVAGVPDGEDSAGRARLRMMTPAEIAERAFDTAQQLYAAAADRGHMVAMPTLEEAREMAREARGRN